MPKRSSCGALHRSLHPRQHDRHSSRPLVGSLRMLLLQCPMHSCMLVSPVRQPTSSHVPIGHLQVDRRTMGDASCSAALLARRRQMMNLATELACSHFSSLKARCGSRSLLRKRSSTISTHCNSRYQASSAPTAATMQPSSCLRTVVWATVLDSNGGLGEEFGPQASSELSSFATPPRRMLRTAQHVCSSSCYAYTARHTVTAMEKLFMCAQSCSLLMAQRCSGAYAGAWQQAAGHTTSAG